MTPDELKDRGLRVKWYAEICAALEPIAPPVDASYVAGWMAAVGASVLEIDHFLMTKTSVTVENVVDLKIHIQNALTPPVASTTPPKTGTYIFPDSETPAQKATPPLDVAQAARVLLEARTAQSLKAVHAWMVTTDTTAFGFSEAFERALRAIAGGE